MVNYLERFLPDPWHTVLFVGYQAEGTPGRQIQRTKRGEKVLLGGNRVVVRAHIESISGFSAHADQSNLIDFVSQPGQQVDNMLLVHGSYKSQRKLEEALETHVANVECGNRL